MECIKNKNKNRKQEWITQKIMNLMVERLKQKTNALNYKQINKIVKSKCREAKEEWMRAKCQEIEQLQRRCAAFNVYKNVKEMAGRHRRQQDTFLRNNTEIILGTEDKEAS